DRDGLAGHTQGQDPTIQELDEEIAGEDELLVVLHRENREQRAAFRQSVLQKLETVNDSIKEWEQKVRETSQRLADVERHRLDVQRAQGSYDRLHNTLQGLDLNHNLDQELVTRMQGSSVAAAKPRGLLGMLGGASLAGLALGLALLYFLESSDDQFNSIAVFGGR